MKLSLSLSPFPSPLLSPLPPTPLPPLSLSPSLYPFPSPLLSPLPPPPPPPPPLPSLSLSPNLTRTSRFATFPEYLVLQINRYYIGEDWTAKKYGNTSQHIIIPSETTIILVHLGHINLIGVRQVMCIPCCMRVGMSSAWKYIQMPLDHLASTCI